jgi:hypothetical protein
LGKPISALQEPALSVGAGSRTSWNTNPGFFVVALVSPKRELREGRKATNLLGRARRIMPAINLALQHSSRERSHMPIREQVIGRTDCPIRGTRSGPMTIRRNIGQHRLPAALSRSHPIARMRVIGEDAGTGFVGAKKRGVSARRIGQSTDIAKCFTDRPAQGIHDIDGRVFIEHVTGRVVDQARLPMGIGRRDAHRVDIAEVRSQRKTRPNLHAADQRRLCGELRTGSRGVVHLDTGVVEKTTAPELRVRGLFRDRYVGVVRKSHPLSKGQMTSARYVGGRHIRFSRLGLAKGPFDELLETLWLRGKSS